MKKDFWKYVISLLIFGSNGIIAQSISLTSYEIVLFRAVFGSMFLIVVFFITRHRLSIREHKRDSIFIALSGIAMASNWIFLYEAYATIGVSLGLILNYCGPIIIIALSPILFKEKITIHKIIALAAALVGIILISGNAVSTGLSIWGIACGILSAISYSVMVIFNKQARKIHGFENATLQLFFTCITMIVFIGIKQQFVIHVEPKDYLAILCLGLVNTGIACYLYFSTVGKLPVQTVAICGYLEPASAVVLSFLILQERMGIYQVIGACLIVAGAVYGENFKKGIGFKIRTKDHKEG